MIRSMTAFARAESGAAVWEIRSVNHRYLDLGFRLPENLRYLEPELKGEFRGKVHRGKVECSLQIKAAELPVQFIVNEPLVAALTHAIGKVKAATGIRAEGDLVSLLRWPDLLATGDVGDELLEDIRAALGQAVARLVSMRGREGEALAGLVESRLRDITATVGLLRAEAPAVLAGQHEKLVKRLRALDLSVDESRLEQELVILAQKLDVTEELDRLLAHVAEVRRNLTLAEPVGRRLDFLMQELNREANTLSSKASASPVTMKAVDLKVAIEQMREQIQNIE